MNNFYDDDQSQNLQEVIAKGLQAAGQIGQNAQAMSPLGGNRIAQRMAATQNQARQALDRQQIPAPTTNVGDLTQWMRTNANLDPERNNRDSSWQKTLSQMAMAQKTDWQTMLGFALGKLLRGGFDDWKEKYDARGYLKSLETPESQVNTEILRQYLPNGDWQGATTGNTLTPWQQQLREAVRLQRW